MKCDECGVVLPAMKTVCWRDDEDGEEYALCDLCWQEVADEVWIVPGMVYCFGTCRECGKWFSVNVLANRTGGGRWGSITGVCPGCPGA